MLNPIVIMRKGAAGVVGRIDEDALHPAGIILLEGLESEEVVAVDKLIVEEVVFGNAVGGVVALLGVVEEDARFEAGADILADPGEFEVLLRHERLQFLLREAAIGPMVECLR
jgi:hypothetical protein